MNIDRLNKTMNKTLEWLFDNVALYRLFIRCVLAYTFIPAGWAKLMGGTAKWLWLGTQMNNLGIYFAPVSWGLAAACAEFFGGIALLFGLGTRIAAFFVSCVMIVAIVMHITHGDSFWAMWDKPFFLLVLLILLLITGGGNYSLDYYIAKQWYKK